MTGSMDYSSNHSPFPFSQRPSLPHIDKHLTNEKLKSRQFIQLDTHQLDPEVESQEEEIADSYGYFTYKEIKDVYKFIKDCGKLDERRFGISLDELVSAFRKVRRARQSKDEEEDARRLMNTFEFLLKLKRTSPKIWFKTMDTSQANRGDGKLTRLEFEAGMNKTCQELGASLFLKHELQAMIKYMDPNGDGDLSYKEVQSGFDKIHRTSESTEVILKSGPIMLYLLDFMHEQQIRVRDLFNFMDLKNRKVVEMQDLCSALDRIAAFLKPSQSLIEEYGQMKRNLGPMKPVRSLDEADNIHASPPPKKKVVLPKANSFKQTLPGAALPSINTGATWSSTDRSGFVPMSPVKRTPKQYDKHVKKKFRQHNAWIDQFDRKLQNGLIIMSKM